MTRQIHEARLDILKIDPAKRGDLCRFDHATIQQIDLLLARGLANADGRQNDSPTYRSFLEFMDDHPSDVTAYGYVIGPGRSDSRVTIEGLRLSTSATLETRARFQAFCRTADELTELRSWWD